MPGNEARRVGLCDWDQVSRWWLEIDPVVDDATGLELFHIYELDEKGVANTEDPIHTVFSPRNEQKQQIKQYLDGAKSHSDCFGVLREGPTGIFGTMTSDCYDENSDDTGKTVEPKPSDSGTNQADTSAWSALQDSASADGTAEPLYPVRRCRCSSAGGAGTVAAWSLFSLLGWRLRRRR